MKNKKLVLILSFTFSGFLMAPCLVSAQTSSTRSRSGGFGSTTTGSSSNTNTTTNSRTAAVNDLLSAYIIGGMLRHPDPNIRKQAIQSLAKGLSVTSSSTSTSNTDTGGARNRIFSSSTTSTSSSSSTSSDTTGSVGPIIYIPDLYVLLADPDPEVRDLASAGLDMIMGTDVTLLRMLTDPEPLIRNYATKIYATRSFSGTSTTTSSTDNSEELGDINELLALRTMLVRLKHETNLEVRKTIIDAIEWYIKRGGTGTKEGETGSLTGMFGVDPSVLKYLDDPNPELRKNAIRIVSQMDSSYDTLTKFMEKLKTEQDEGVKKELQNAIDSFMKKHRTIQSSSGENIPLPTENPAWTLE